MEQPNGNFNALWKHLCLEDDRKSFELIFYQLNRKLINFCNNLIHNEDSAEEIVSDVFVSCWCNRKNLAELENPKSYLYVAVKNKSLNYLKKYSPLQVLPLELTNEFVVIDSTDPNLELEKKEFFFKVDQMIEKLPKQTLQVFRLIKEDGMKYKEVAELLDISPRTVQTHMTRAIKKISSLLKAYASKEKSPIIDRFLLISFLVSCAIALLP